MTDKELDEMIAEANCDKDGHIDYEGTNFPKGFSYYISDIPSKALERLLGWI